MNKRVDQGEPARLDDVLGDADRAPDRVVVLALDHDTDAGGGAGAGVDDADLVVDQLHLAEPGIVPLERLAEGAVEGVHRAVPLAHGVLDDVADLELDRRLGNGGRPGWAMPETLT